MAEPDTDAPAASEALDAPALLVPLDPQALLTKAIEHQVPVETLERLLTLRERLKAEQARTAFFTALAAFQAECPIVPKTKRITIRPASGAAYSYSYSPIEVIVEQVRPLLQKHGLSYTIKTRQDEASLTAICEAHHEAGHTEPSELTVPIDKAARMNDTQKVGAARTYACRYAFCNAFGIMTGDEDVDAATAEADAPTVTFDPPRRTQAPTPPPSRPTPATPSLPLGAAADGEERAPADALSGARLTRLWGLLRAAIREHDVPDDQADAVFERAHDWLTAWVVTETGRSRLKHCSWRDYDRLCDQVPGAVAAALRGPAPKTRWVAARRPSSPRR